MGKYDSKLLGSEEIARATFAFHFEKPDGLEFTPGESINLFLPEDFPGVSDDRQRAFSLVNAPHEGSPMPYSIFFLRGYAIHGSYETKYLGRPVSHGCIRLHPSNAVALYSLVRQHGTGNTTIRISH